MFDPEVLKASVEEDLGLLDEMAKDFSQDLNTLEQIKQNRIDSYWQDLALRGIGQRLHQYYHTIEKILETIFEATGEGIPKSRDYHYFLLKQAFLPLSRRPSVFQGEDLREFLDELRRYRHLFRNLYRNKIKPENLERLVRMARHYHQLLRKQLEDFTTALLKSSMEQTNLSHLGSGLDF